MLKKMMIVVIACLGLVVCSINTANADTINNPKPAKNTLVVTYSDKNGSSDLSGKGDTYNETIKHVKTVVIGRKTVVKLDNGTQILLGDDANVVVGKGVHIRYQN